MTHLKRSAFNIKLCHFDFFSEKILLLCAEMFINALLKKEIHKGANSFNLSFTFSCYIVSFKFIFILNNI